MNNPTHTACPSRWAAMPSCPPLVTRYDILINASRTHTYTYKYKQPCSHSVSISLGGNAIVPPAGHTLRHSN